MTALQPGSAVQGAPSVRLGSVVVANLDGGDWSASFGLSLINLLLADGASSQRIVPAGMHLRSFCGADGISVGRNNQTAAFLDRTAGEWLLMIDADMGFEPDVAEALIDTATKANALVVGGLCFALRRSGRGDAQATRFRIVPTIYTFHELDDEVGFLPMADYPRDRATPVAATGAACLLVHRGALEAVRAAYGDEWFTHITHPKGKDGPTRFSEDLSFCVRLAAVDVEILVDTRVKTSHDKGGVFLDEHTYDLQAAADAHLAEGDLEPSAAGA